jgi:Protein of unknown function (DUF3592)
MTRNQAQDGPLTTIFRTECTFPAEPPAAPLSTDQSIQAVVGALCKLAGFFALVCAVGLLLLSGYLALRVHEQLGSWPRAHAQVLSSEIYEKELRTSSADGIPARSTVYGYRWIVSFEVGSRAYQAPIDIGYQQGNRGDMREWLLRYPDGTQITIAYDPANPAHTRLAEDFRSAYAPVVATLRLCAWFLGGGILTIFISRRLQVPQPSAG